MEATPLKPEYYSRADLAGAVLVILVMVMAVLFPENYMPDAIRVGSQRLLPLTLFLPLFAIGSLAYIWHRRCYYNPDVIDVALIVFFIYFLARNITGPAGGASLKYTVYGLGLFYLASLLMFKDRPRQAIVTVMVALAGLMALYGIVEYALGENVIYGGFVSNAVVEDVGSLHRAGSSLAHPVAFGAFLVQVLPFSVLFWLKGGNQINRTMGAVTSLLVLVALFFTFSKGSWITAAILLVAVALALLYGKGRKALVFIFVFIALGAVMTGVFWQQVSTETSERMEQSVSFRADGWRGAYEGMINNPLTGVGLRQGRIEILKHCYTCRAFLFFEGREKPVDNNYVNTLLEQGFVGFSLWLIFLVLLLVGGIAALEKAAKVKPWLLAALVSVIGLSINAVTFDAMLIWSNYIIFWIAAGILHGNVLRSHGLGEY